MKTEEEIKEAIEAADSRRDDLDVPDRGNPGADGILDAMCEGNIEALKWVLEDEDGFINGLSAHKKLKGNE